MYWSYIDNISTKYWQYIDDFANVLIIYWQHINQILAIYWRWWFHHLMAKFWSELTEFCRNSLPITSQRNLLWWWWRWRWRSMTMMMTMVMMMMILSRQQWILSDFEDDVGKWWYFSAVNLIILLEKLCHRKYRVPSRVKSNSFVDFSCVYRKLTKLENYFWTLSWSLAAGRWGKSCDWASMLTQLNVWKIFGLSGFEDFATLRTCNSYPCLEKLLLHNQLLLLNAQRHSSFSHCLRSSLLELGGLVVKKQIWSLDRARAPMCLKLAFCIFICDW